jgi:hypothetical protein
VTPAEVACTASGISSHYVPIRERIGLAAMASYNRGEQRVITGIQIALFRSVPEMLSPAPAATPNDFFHTRSTDDLHTQAVRAPTIERAARRATFSCRPP